MTKQHFLRIRHAIAVDVLCIILSFAASFIIRFEPAGEAWPLLVRYQSLLWLSLAVRLPAYILFGLYHHHWGYASTRELKSILAAGSVGSLLVGVGNFILLPGLGLASCDSRSILILDWLLNVALLSATRLALRIAREHTTQRNRKLPPSFIPSEETRPVLVIGAGDAGARIVREMQQNQESGLVPVALVDDSPDKQRMRIHGVPVLGRREDIPALAKRLGIREAVIAIPSASGTTVRALRRICLDARIPFRIIPSIHEVLDRRSTVKQLREVRIEDLLRRDPIVTDQAGVRAYITNTCVLVTGAGGSIGSELCRQIAVHRPSLLVLVGHGEFSIFTIERELRQRFPELPLKAVIADVRDFDRISGIVRHYQPTTIFHAAAHKHVPLMEGNVEEAFTNNVIGTQCVLRAAEQHHVERFLLISSDKAVNPTSVMGATKRIAELLAHDTAVRTGRPYVAVRFGNVLGSRGSVVPIFREQIAAGGPVTVTHPEMRRYFMTIPEAVQLVLQAAALGKGGEVFMLDMGEPVKILDLVNDLIELSGLTPGDDIEVEFTGLRPGEKLYEELTLDDERYGPTTHDKVFVCRNGKTPHLSGKYLEGKVAAAAEFAYRMSKDDVLTHILELVPEFRSEQAPVAVPRSAIESSRPLEAATTGGR